MIIHLIATTNSSLTPNDRKHRLLNQHSLQVWEMPNTKRPIEILTSPNTDVALLDKDGATMGTGRTNETGHVTIIPQQLIPKGDVSRKPHVVQKA